MSGAFSERDSHRSQKLSEIIREAFYGPFEEAGLLPRQAPALPLVNESPQSSTQEPPDNALACILHHPLVILILGHRGSGKSALACRLQELLRGIAPPYAVGLPANAVRLLPTWYGLTDDPLDIPTNATIYIPESHRLFHARSSQTAQGRVLRVGEPLPA